MRKNMVIAILLAVLITGMGCMRIVIETEAQHPTQRFYSGTKELFLAPRDLVMGLGTASVGSVASGSASDTAKGIFIGLPLSIVFITAFIVDIPLEIALDTLFLPVDGVFYTQYVSNPPLDKYLYDNDLEGMKTALEKGADPNAIHPLFIKKEPVIVTAFKKQNEAIFELLLEYGATIPFSILEVFDLNSAKMLRRAFKDGCPKELLEKDSSKYVVSKWIRFHLGRWNRAPRDADALVDILMLLMENGFPPVCEGEESGIHGKKTSLDVVLENLAMETLAKDRLVAAMRAYGAKRYCELHNQAPPSGHLNTDSLKIDAMFQPVIDILEESNRAGLFVLKDSYPGVDGPVLVIDKPLVEEPCFPDFKRKLYYRSTIRIHRRVSKTEWSERTETLDVPSWYRIVLTPPGKRLPSRRPNGMPTECGFWEAWYTLPTCELYVEHTMSCGDYPDRDLLRICLLAMGLDDNRELTRCILFAPEKVDKSIMDLLKWPAARKYNESNLLDDLAWMNKSREEFKGEFAITDKERRWLSKATKTLAAIGISAEWSKFGPNTSYAFSTYRDMAKITSEECPYAPRPDEIVAIIAPLGYYSPAHQPFSHEGKNYWNRSSRPCVFPSVGNSKGAWKGSVFLFYGDSVSEKRLEEVFQALETLKK